MKPTNRTIAPHAPWGERCDAWRLVDDVDLTVIEECMGAGTAETLHVHTRARQVFFVLEGQLLVELCGKDIELLPGDALHIPPQTLHEVRNESGADTRFLVVSTPSAQGDRVRVSRKQRQGRPERDKTSLNFVFFDGAWQPFTSVRDHQLFNPHTEQKTGILCCPASDIVDAVVGSAVRAQRVWSASALTDRLTIITQITELIEARADEFATIISNEIGAPIDFARTAQVGAAISHLRATQDALANMEDTHLPGGDPAHLVRHEAVGVAALITPWNWPLNQVVLKLGAALAAGCAIVLKPSEYATRTAIALAEIIAESDLLPGVFNLLIGDAQTGTELVAHPSVDMISFTGSTRGGQHVAHTAAKRFARTAMELGGKSANLLFEDCDLETAIQQGVAHCFRNAGQSCNAASRMLVARPIYEDAVELAAEIASNTPVGCPSESGAHIGPLVNRRQFDHVQDLIQQGIASEARLVTGGPGRPAHLPTGFYARPTVFADVSADNVLFQREIFGPVLTMAPFEDEAQAIELANATEYGLAAYIQTQDAARAERVAAQLRAGMIQINGTSRASGAPFGGVKASGYGREGGLWGIRQFQEVKSISGMLTDDG